MKTIDNKYKTWYYNLCNTRSKLNRSKKNGYFESYHIVPKSLGGSNCQENLVLLTAREHYIAHLLLTKFIEGEDRNKMIYSWNMLSNFSKSSSKTYESLKKEFSLLQSINAKNNKNCLGRIYSNETLIKMSKSKLGNKNPMFGKKHKKESIDKMKSAGFTKSHRRKISEAKKGKQKTKVCPYCGKSGGLSNMTRWHFDNCKFR